MTAPIYNDIVILYKGKVVTTIGYIKPYNVMLYCILLWMLYYLEWAARKGKLDIQHEQSLQWTVYDT